MNDPLDFDDDDFPPDLYPIRLAGPWECLPQGDSSAEPVRIRLPLEENLPSGGNLRLTRRFQRPTNLDPEERVLLLLPEGLRAARAWINDREFELQRLVGSRPAADLTPLLADSNLLAIELDAADAEALRSPVLLGVMPDADGSWWQSLPTA